MNYLNRIIAVNSFLLSKNYVDIYDIHGGSVILGTNTKGKSSFLRTQLLFYGAKPEQVSLLSGNRNLTNFYFKTDSSYLVFEYIKDGKPNLVVMFSSDRQSVSYRFVAGAFSESLFAQIDDVTNKKIFVNNRDLKKHLKSQGRDVSAILKYQEYTSVIQSGKFERGEGNEGRKRNELRHQFSICPKDVSISGIDRIALSIIDSKPSIETIKRLLANDVTELGTEIQKNITDRIKGIDSLNRDMKIVEQAKRFQEKRHVVQDLMSLRQAVKANGLRLKGLKSEAESLLTVKLNEFDSLQKEISSIKTERQEKERKYERERSELVDSIGKLESQLSHITKSIANLEETYEKYHQDEIEIAGTQGNQVSTITSELDMLQKRLVALEEKHERIISQYDQELQSFKEERTLYVESERQKFDRKVGLLRKEKEEQNELLKKVISSINAKFSKRRRELWVLKSDIQSKLATLNESLKNPYSAEIGSLNKTLQTALINLETANNRYQSLSGELSKLQEQSRSLTREREGKFNQQTNLESDNEKVKASLISLQKELEDVESMLYFKLLEQNPDKAEMLAKTMRESVLKSRVVGELAVTEDSTSFMGIDFDFGQFEAQRPDAKDVIETNLKNLTALKNQNDESLSILEREISALNDKVKRINGEINQKTVDLKTCVKEITSEKDSKKECESNIEEAKRSLIAEIHSEIESLTNEQTENNDQLEHLDSTEQAELEEANKAHLEKTSLLENKIHEALVALEAEQARILNEISDKTNEIERLKNIDLNESGARTDEINKAQGAIKKLKKHLSEAKSAKEKYERYQLWLSHSYSKLGEFRSEHEEIKVQLSSLNTNKEAFIRSETSGIEALQKTENKLEEQINGTGEDIKTLEGLLAPGDTYFAKLESKKYFDRSSPTAKEIYSQVRKYVKENSEYISKGKQDFSLLVRTFRTYTELSNLCSELLAHESALEINSSNDWIESILSMDLLLNGTLEQEIQARVDSFRALGDHLLNLNDQLDEIDSSIASIGRKITKHMNSSAQYFDAIGELKAKIGSKIPELSFKKSLSEATSVINRKKGLEPDSEFLDAVTQAVNSINRDAIDMDVTKMISITIYLENESGVIKPATTDSELLKISSEGMSFLILVMIFVAIKNSISNNKGVELLWSMDEVGRIHPENVKIISEILKKEGISFLCAGPSIDAEVASLFENIYKVVQDNESGLDFIVKTQAPQTAYEIYMQAYNESQAKKEALATEGATRE